jgi:hypothetical protein
MDAYDLCRLASFAYAPSIEVPQLPSWCDDHENFQPVQAPAMQAPSMAADWAMYVSLAQKQTV